jgi:hypothetical protein
VESAADEQEAKEDSWVVQRIVAERWYASGKSASQRQYMVQWHGKPAPTGRGATDWLNADQLEEEHDLHAQKAEWRGKTKREDVSWVWAGKLNSKGTQRTLNPSQHKIGMKRARHLNEMAKQRLVALDDNEDW